MMLNRFKYFSIYYIKMVQYYIKELSHIDTSRISNKFSHISRIEPTIFSKDGKYKVYNNKIYKYKLVSTHSEIIPQFIDNYTLLTNKNHWKREITYNLPFINQGILYISFVEYNIHPKLKFIVEKIEDNIHDFYFQSKEHYDNIKSDISSFLSFLK